MTSCGFSTIKFGVPGREALLSWEVGSNKPADVEVVTAMKLESRTLKYLAAIDVGTIGLRTAIVEPQAV